MNYYNLIINLALIKRINSIQTYFPILPAFYALYHIIKNKLSNITIFFIFLIITFSIANYSEIISNFNFPLGTEISATSPSDFPSNPFPIGELTDILPSLKFASLSATN